MNIFTIWSADINSDNIYMLQIMNHDILFIPVSKQE